MPLRPLNREGADVLSAANTPVQGLAARRGALSSGSTGAFSAYGKKHLPRSNWTGDRRHIGAAKSRPGRNVEAAEPRLDLARRYFQITPTNSELAPSVAAEMKWRRTPLSAGKLKRFAGPSKDQSVGTRFKRRSPCLIRDQNDDLARRGARCTAQDLSHRSPAVRTGRAPSECRTWLPTKSSSRQVQSTAPHTTPFA